MASNGGVSVLVAALVMCLLVAAPRPTSSAISCGAVASAVTPCITYIRKQGPLTTACCNGVRSLNSKAATTPDRQAACACLKKLAGVPGLDPPTAASLPSKCGVSIPYPISTSTDCSRVQ
uniref:Non-specific lipid-transfer protein n=1 Tax=Anthurium amnicola TaxID=1678845 RepID=A0A1D1ZDG6_9ARAE